MQRPFRFGYQLSADDESNPQEAAKRAEASGFDVVLTSDHVGPGASPMIALSAMAQVTERIRLSTFVLNNDMRNPVQLAWEAATLDRLSNGRFELGLGAGHTPQEYRACGTTFDKARVRKERLMESVEVIRRLVDGESVTFEGKYVKTLGAEITPASQARLPILVGGNGEALLSHAGSHADIIGLQGLGRTLDDGHSHNVKWGQDWLDLQVEQVRSGAGDRFSEVELNALVQVTRFTDDRSDFIDEILQRVAGLTAEDAEATPYVLFGNIDQIAAKIRACRERWGISYFVVRECEPFADVIRALQ